VKANQNIPWISEAIVFFSYPKGKRKDISLMQLSHTCRKNAVPRQGFGLQGRTAIRPQLYISRFPYSR
jgi:hypothetical protein